MYDEQGDLSSGWIEVHDWQTKNMRKDFLGQLWTLRASSIDGIMANNQGGCALLIHGQWLEVTEEREEVDKMLRENEKRFSR